MPCGWEGNRRSGVALAMRHRLQWFIHLRAHSLREMSTPPTLLIVYDILSKTLCFRYLCVWGKVQLVCTGPTDTTATLSYASLKSKMVQLCSAACPGFPGKEAIKQEFFLSYGHCASNSPST